MADNINKRLLFAGAFYFDSFFICGLTGFEGYANFVY